MPVLLDMIAQLCERFTFALFPWWSEGVVGTVPWASSPLLPHWKFWFLWVRRPCGGGGGIWDYSRALTSARVSARKVSALGPGRGEEEGRGILWAFGSSQLRLAGCGWLGRCKLARHSVEKGEGRQTYSDTGPVGPEIQRPNDLNVHSLPLRICYLGRVSRFSVSLGLRR